LSTYLIEAKCMKNVFFERVLTYLLLLFLICISVLMLYSD